MERHALNLMTSLTDAGQTVSYAGPGDSWLAEQCHARHITHLDLGMHGMADLGSMLRLARFLRRWQADVVHGHSQRGTHYAVWSGRLSGCATVATAHSTNAYRRFNGARRVICVSDAVRDFLIGHGLPPAKLRRIYSGVDDLSVRAPTRDEARSRLGATGHPHVLGLVARFERDKGHDVAVDAIRRLARKDTLLLLAGDHSTKYGQEILRQVGEFGLSDQIRFLGQRSDVETVYAACDLLLAPSRREALSLSLIEAASVGLPAVASRVGGIPEAVEDGVTGVLVPPEDSAALAVTIRSLLEQPALRANMRLAARQRYLKLFGLAAMCDAVVQVYREAASGA